METQLDLLLIKQQQQQQQAIRQFSIHIDKVHTTNSYSPGRLELNRFQALVLCGVWRVSHRIVQPQTHTHTLTEKWMNIGIESVLIENIHNLHTPRQLSTVECECWGDGVLLCMPSPFCRNWHRCKLFAFWLAVTSCQLLRCKLHLQLQLIWLIWLIWITLVYIDFSCKTIFFLLSVENGLVLKSNTKHQQQQQPHKVRQITLAIWRIVNFWLECHFPRAIDIDNVTHTRSDA